MDFKAKLGLLARAPPSTQTSAPRERSALSRLLPPTQTSAGPLHCAQSCSEAPALPSAEVLAVLGVDEVFASVEPSSLLFLDTETTGLAGGAGTLPFLIGLAFVEHGQLVVEQLHLDAPGGERPVLARLAERLARASAIVSFNGRSFDWPLLRTRFVMNRLPLPPPLPHLDLLHASRRVLRHWTDQLRLSAIERAVLGVQRSGDIDGALIPAAWFDFLRTGRVATLGRVLQHNLEDVRSTVSLLEWLGQVWSGTREVPVEVSLGVGELAERVERLELAQQRYERAIDSVRAEVRVRAWIGLGRVFRKQGAVRRAAAAWERASALCPGLPGLHLALARLYEHRLRDWESAARHVPLSRGAEHPLAHTRRLERVARKRQLLLDVG